MSSYGWLDRGAAAFAKATDGGKVVWPDQKTAYIAGFGQGGLDERFSVVLWLRGLAARKDCPPDRRYWYEGVAADIEGGRVQRMCSDGDNASG